MGKFCWIQLRLLGSPSRRKAIKKSFRSIVALVRLTVVSPKDALSRIKGTTHIASQKLAHFFDPRVVRLEEPNRYMVHSFMISLLFVGMAITAFAVAASAKKASKKPMGSQASTENVLKNEDPSSARTAWLGQSEQNNAVNFVKVNTVVPTQEMKIHSPKKKRTALPSNYYNPIYVFTQAEATNVSAYPLAEPPGVVINLQGLEEPEKSAENMVGEDPRIIKIKRRVTSSGLRYILHLKQPIKKIETHKEGNVVTINPL